MVRSEAELVGFLTELHGRFDFVHSSNTEADLRIVQRCMNQRERTAAGEEQTTDRKEDDDQDPDQLRTNITAS